MRNRSKIISSKGRHGLLLVVACALMLELLSAAQYYYSHYLMEDELEKRAEMELTTKAIIASGMINNSERSLKSHIMEVKKSLATPDSLPGILAWILKFSPNLKGCGIAFKPGYYKDRDYLFEPYALRTDSGIQRLQVAGEGFDYTKDGFYRYIKEKKTNSWVGPYDDAYLKEQLITYAVPIYEFTGDTVAVLGIDIETQRLSDTLNYRHIYPSSFDLLLTKDGQLIAGPLDPNLDRKVEDVIRVVNDSTIKKSWIRNGRMRKTSYYDKEAGDELTVFFASVKGAPHWQIVLVCYDDEVFGVLRKLRVRMLLMSILAFGILLFIVGYFARNEEKLKQKTLEEERIAGELRVASQIQQSMLPPSHLETDDVNISASLVPAREVGGDLYDYFIRDEKLFFCIGDVSGKGAPSAMLMAVIHALFRAFSAHENNPARIMGAINEASCSGNDSNMFVTLFIGVLDLPTGRLRYCDAGHDAPFILNEELRIKNEECATALEVQPNLPVGVFDDVKYGLQEIQLQPDSTIFLYTDGLTEAKNEARKQFGLERVEAVLTAQVGKQPQEILEQVTEAVHGFVKNAEQSDDLTMLAIRYTPQQFKSKLTETLVLKNDVHEIARFSSFIKQAMEKLDIEKSLARQLRLAVEEAVVNVIDYAYPVGTEGEITVRIMSDGQRLHCQIIDSGIPFDPTAKEKADTSLSVEDRQIGGLGILLVREQMDSINYERIDGKNILTLIKKIGK